MPLLCAARFDAQATEEREKKGDARNGTEQEETEEKVVGRRARAGNEEEGTSEGKK